jgi:hypothetical protein
MAETAFKGEVELTIRGVTRTVPLDIAYIGEWKTRAGSALGLGEDHAEQHESVEVRRLVGVVLNGEQVITEPVTQTRRLEHPVGVAGVRAEEVPELQAMAVVGHRAQPTCEARM